MGSEGPRWTQSPVWRVVAELVKGEKPEVSGKSMECEAEKRLQRGEGGVTGRGGTWEEIPERMEDSHMSPLHDSSANPPPHPKPPGSPVGFSVCDCQERRRIPPELTWTRPALGR